MSFPYTIRPAHPADLDRLAELMHALQDHLEATNPDLWRIKPGARADLKGQLAARLTAANTHLLVAEHAVDGLVGAISGRIVTNKRYIPDRAGVVDQAYVQPAHRRMGVGSRLVAELCRLFAESGVEDLSLRYMSGNERAAEFWSALGFATRIITVGAKRQTVESQLTQKRE